VSGSTNTGRERFSGNDEGGRVGTEVEEELHESEACNEWALSDMVDFSRENGKEERGHEEATELEPFTTNDIDGEEGEVVAWEETKGSDDDVTGGESEELTPDILSLSRVTDLSEHDRLVQL